MVKLESDPSPPSFQVEGVKKVPNTAQAMIQNLTSGEVQKTERDGGRKARTEQPMVESFLVTEEWEEEAGKGRSWRSLASLAAVEEEKRG